MFIGYLLIISMHFFPQIVLIKNERKKIPLVVSGSFAKKLLTEANDIHIYSKNIRMKKHWNWIFSHRVSIKASNGLGYKRWICLSISQSSISNGRYLSLVSILILYYRSVSTTRTFEIHYRRFSFHEWISFSFEKEQYCSWIYSGYNGYEWIQSCDLWSTSRCIDFAKCCFCWCWSIYE